MCRSVLNKPLIKLRILDLSSRRQLWHCLQKKDYLVISTAKLSIFFATADRGAGAATVCKICYPNEFSLRMTFNSRNVCLFLAAAIFVRTSPQDNPKGNLDGKFQNKTK